MNAIIKQVVKVVRLRYPNDKTLSADCVTHKITFTAKDGTVRTEQATKDDSEYLPMLGDLYEFKVVHKIDMDLIASTFTIYGTDFHDEPKTQKV